MVTEMYPKALFSLSTPSIVWMEGDGNYSRIHLSNGKVELLPWTLKLLSGKLPDFVRIHKSSLINPMYVGEFKSRGYRDYYVKLSSGEVLSVSRKRIHQTAVKLNMPLPDSY